MRKALGLLVVWSLLVLGSTGLTEAQTLHRVLLKNRSHQSVYIVAYNPYCRVTVFEGVLNREGVTQVRICADDRGYGSLVVYDVRGRSLKFPRLRNGQSVHIRFR